MAAAVLRTPSLAPRPLLWNGTDKPIMIEGKENRPASKQLQQPAQPNRSRRERPCDGCRRRKSKCVLQDSRKCVLCEFHKQACTFVESAQPRKRRSEDASGEARKKSATDTALWSSSQAGASLANAGLQRLSPSLQHVASRDTPPLMPFAGQVFAVDESLSLQRHRHCRYLGHTTALDASLVSLSTFDSRNETECRLGTLRHVAGADFFTTHADADLFIPDDETRALADIDALVGPHGDTLIDIYFRHVHASYPVIQKQLFLDRHRHGDRSFNPPLLAAMYLLALAWWDSEPALAGIPKPDAARLEMIAITTLTRAMRRPKMSAVQAGVLLLQRARSSTWTLTVQLVALGQDVGLHLDCSDWSIPLWERRLRKRLAWALYMQDKWSALVHGRPSHINACDWAVPPLTDVDFDDMLPSSGEAEHDADDPDLAKGRMLFMQMISLTAIMAEVCGAFYSQAAVAEFKRAGPHATQIVLNRAKPVQIKLKDWFARLPPECKLEASSAAAADSCVAAASLHLAYFATEITIHRRIVRSLVPGPAASSASVAPRIDPYMLYICRSAAKTRLISAMDFVNRLTPAHLQAFWFFASPANLALIGVFGALLQATSPGAEEAAFYAARRREFRWTLAVSVGRAAWIEAAIEVVEASAEMLEGLEEKPCAGGFAEAEYEFAAGDDGADDETNEDMEI